MKKETRKRERVRKEGNEGKQNEKPQQQKETAASINKVIYKFKLNKYSIRFLDVNVKPFSHLLILWRGKCKRENILKSFKHCTLKSKRVKK